MFIPGVAIAAMLLSLSLGFAAAREGPPIVATTIDFMDSVWGVNRVWTEEDTEELMKRCADAGIRRIYLRFANGVTYYPSKVTKMYTDDGREPGGRLVAETIRSYDVLESHIRVGHKHGLQMYFYETLYDDEITCVHYAKGTKEEQLYGEFPLKSPFTIEHPEYQIEHRRAREIETLAPGPRRIAVIKLYGADANPTRIDQAHLALYTSDDNVAYTAYDRPWSFADSVENGVRVLTLAGLDMKARFIKVHCTYADADYTFWNKPGRFVRVFGPDGEELAGATICYLENDKTPESQGFVASSLGFALDYNSRSLGICFDFFSPYIGGMLEYCYPEARAFRVAMVREVAENYAIDGVAFCLRTHSQWRGNVEDFGFGEPVVAEYKRRYGVDIRQQEFDRDKWAQIRGEGVTQLLREVSAVLEPRGMRLETMLPPSTVDAAGTRRYRFLDWIDLDWPTWVAEGLVDGLRLNAQGARTWTGLWPEEVRCLRKATRTADTEVVVHFNINTCGPAAFEQVVPALYADPNVDTIELYQETSLWPTSSNGLAYLGLVRQLTHRTK